MAKPGQPLPAVLVLGASRGLGRHIALALARSGFAVGAGCRTMPDAVRIAEEIERASGRAAAIKVDVTEPEEVAAAVEATRNAFGVINGLVNNAGVIEPLAKISDATPADWNAALRVNLFGPFLGVLYALRAFEEGGVIINISSGAASRPFAGWSAYCCSKAGLAMLTRMVQHEYGDAGVFAYGFRPGVVDTEMQVRIRQSGLTASEPADLLPPELPAEAVSWLAKNRPPDLVGQEIDIRDPEFRRRIG